VDDLLQQARVEGDQAKRKSLYDQAMAILVKEVPYIYTVHDNVLFGIAKSVKGFQYVPDGVIRTATVSSKPHGHDDQAAQAGPAIAAVGPTLLLVSMVVFSLLAVLPGDPVAAILGMEATRKRRPRCA
jgi:hypothetical protein